jgi:hypothetical protein
MPDLALMHVNEDEIAKAEEATKVPIVNGGDNNDRYSTSLLFIRTVLQRVFAIMLGMEPEWVEALKLLNKLTVGAPLASVLQYLLTKTTSKWTLVLSNSERRTLL